MIPKAVISKRLVTPIGLAAAIAIASAMATTAFVLAAAEPPAQAPTEKKGRGLDAKKEAPAPPKVKLGLSINEPGAYRGYTLLNPMNFKKTYLIDLNGRVVKSWESQHNSMHAAYLLENGHLFRIAVLEGGERKFGGGPGSAGRIQEFDWDGNLVWDYEFHNDKQYLHHDAAKLPNGNVLMIVWDKKSRDEAIAAGRKPELVSDYVLPDSIVEVKPTGKTTAEVVWEWHLWDHLVQDHDSSKANYGKVADHPELVDMNFAESSMGQGPGGGGPGGPGGPRPVVKKAEDVKKAALKAKAETDKLKSIGYVGSATQQRQRVNPDWTHVNSVAYNPELDQIVVSVHEFSEIWIIDHSTTTAEAAGHTGGRSGKGGDLLYRWGNPRIYRAGTKVDQTLFAQHNAHWIAPGLPGAGHLMVFNNGGHRPDGNYSSVDELVLPVDEKGRYSLEPGKAYGPKAAAWRYTAPKKSDFYAFFISGANRLPNGNTFICSGPNGTMFEVTPEGKTVWKYVNPVKAGFGPPGGPGGPGGPPPVGQVLPFFVRDRLDLSPEQRKAADALQKTIDDTLARTLTDAQRKTLKERSTPGPAMFAAMPAPGLFMSMATQIALRPTPEQRAKLSALQKEVDATLEKTLNADQKARLTKARADFLRGGPGGPGGLGGGPPGGGPPAFLFAGPPGGSGVFRAYRYGPDYPGLAGRELKPGKTVEEMQPKDKDKDKPKAGESQKR